jgi:LPS sulfotransferase NodH
MLTSFVAWQQEVKRINGPHVSSWDRFPRLGGVVAVVGSFEELYEKRRGVYAKDAGAETFLLDLNEYLQQRERALYREYQVEHPFLFVIGLPRSGTTLLSQLLAYCLDAGYINNFSARFWLAPLQGVRLARALVGDDVPSAFASDHARTATLSEIHEFGYFWRHWLKKHTFEDVVHAREREEAIDWSGLKTTLLNLQHEFGRPFVAKNMLGVYHTAKLRDVLEQVIYVHVERDPLDVAISILDARRKYYSDPATWWSYVPVEYPLLEDRDHWEQIAGQIHYLGRFCRRGLAEIGPTGVVNVGYEQLCRDPASVLDAVAESAESGYGYRLRLRQPPPRSFDFRQHDDRAQEKATFERLLAELEADAT